MTKLRKPRKSFSVVKAYVKRVRTKFGIRTVAVGGKIRNNNRNFFKSR
jgi:hypothetical protein